MNARDIRQKYLDFFAARGHAVIPSTSLVPENDPTTLFVSSGMQPLVPYLLGEPHQSGARLVNAQRSFRAEDIEEVGDNRHTTFFEMLGNWSLGDYFKEEQLSWFFALLTDGLGIDPSRLFVTVFIGDGNVPKDTESIAVWEQLFREKGIEAKAVDIGSEQDGYDNGMKGGRIFAYDAKKNWWSRSGTPEKMPEGEPGGPDSEVFYDFGTEHNPSFGKECHVNCDCGRFMEIGNSVFMEYKKVGKGFERLAQRNVDFGGGLERIAAAVLGTPDVFLSDLFKPAIDRVSQISGKMYADEMAPMRVIVDHLRGASQMIADGVLPANSEQGYILRRLIRRAVRHGDTLGLRQGALAEIVPLVNLPFAGVYDHVTTRKDTIQREIKAEEERFRATLDRGLREFEKYATKGAITGDDAFVLFSTYGFPVELTAEMARERDMRVDLVAFQDRMRAHRTTSREGAAGKFKGGLQDHGERSTQYHTLTHMLGEALRRVLGPHVYQKGSNITGERLRFDYSHPEKLTDDEKRAVEDFVNAELDKHHPMGYTLMSVEEAKAYGAIGVFPDRYDERVKVYTLGSDETGIFSKEICGGPHVSNTDDIRKDGMFRIKKEEAVAAGIRRIKGALEA